MHRLIQPILDWYMASLQTGGYPLVVLLMAMESSVLPLPSEFVIPQAAYLAHTRSQMTPIGVVIAGTLGSWIGASIMYWASRWAGRPLILRLGIYWQSRWAGSPLMLWLGGLFLPTQKKLEQAERWSARFGHIGVLFSRMLPVVRHLIGIPSGIVRLNFFTYSVYTIVGSLIWCAVLASVGIFAGNNPDLLKGDMRTITLWCVTAAAVLGGLYYFFVYRFTREEPAN
jgi:membrane protein DedA with SNARE-associated domain